MGKNQWIDISQPLYTGMGVWPGDEGMVHKIVRDMRSGDDNTVSHIAMGAHTGTHVDAPAHFVRDGKRLGEVDMALFLGRAWVVDCSHSKGHITKADLLGRIPPGTLRLLVRTRNSRHGYPASFRMDFTAMLEDAVTYAYDCGVRLLGIDALSIAPMGELTAVVHTAFLSHNDVAVLEGIDLSEAAEGWWELACLPLRLDEAEGAPARAMLRRMEEAI